MGEQAEGRGTLLAEIPRMILIPLILACMVPGMVLALTGAAWCWGWSVVMRWVAE